MEAGCCNGGCLEGIQETCIWCFLDRKVDEKFILSLGYSEKEIARAKKSWVSYLLQVTEDDTHNSSNKVFDDNTVRECREKRNRGCN